MTVGMHSWKVLGVVAVLSCSVSAWAGPATEIVRAKQTELFSILKSPAHSDAKVGAVFDEMLDYNVLAKDSLGSEWDPRSEAERKEFSELLKRLVRRAYEKNLKKTIDYNIEYVREAEKTGGMLVTTRATSQKDKREEPIEIEYKLAETAGAWKVTDIITEGVSLVKSYRSQFTKIVKKDGFPKLIERMKTKIAKGDVG